MLRGKIADRIAGVAVVGTFIAFVVLAIVLNGFLWQNCLDGNVWSCLLAR